MNNLAKIIHNTPVLQTYFKVDFTQIDNEYSFIDNLFALHFIMNNI